jgi:hypothetical protein
MMESYEDCSDYQEPEDHSSPQALAKALLQSERALFFREAKTRGSSKERSWGLSGGGRPVVPRVDASRMSSQKC